MPAGPRLGHGFAATRQANLFGPAGFVSADDGEIIEMSIPRENFDVEGEGVRTRHNLLMVQTMIDKQTDIVLAGVCHDLLVVEHGRPRLRERIVVFNSDMVPNSLIYPA